MFTMKLIWKDKYIWWRHQIETFSALLDLCEGNSPITGEFPSRRPVTRSFDVFFHLCLNKRKCKQSWSWWFETPSRSLWRHCTAKNSSFFRQDVFVTTFSANTTVSHHFRGVQHRRSCYWNKNFDIHMIFFATTFSFLHLAWWIYYMV